MSSALATTAVLDRVPPSLRARVLGLGSVFGKAFRDSRRTAIGLGVVFALVMLVTASQVATQFATIEERVQVAVQLQALPAIFQGMLGEPIHIELMGGFLSWRVLNFLPVMLGIWSIVALSGTLAGELGRGSMDMLASAPVSRARLAVQKLAGYLAALGVTTLILVLGLVAAFAAFSVLPGDSVGLGAIAAHAVWIYLTILVPGAVAFALAPITGRNGALGVGAIVLFGSFVINGFASSVSVFETLRPLSYFGLTAEHRPLADRYDWGSVGALAVITAALLALGVLAFARRDLLQPSSGRLRLPSIGLWLREPFTRAFGERLPSAIVWGLGLGLFGLVIATSADQFVASMGAIPQVTQMIKQIFPGQDILSTGGFLQLAFFSEAIIVVGLAAGGFVGGWASDEADRRLELILGAPVSRARWALRSATAVMGAIAVMTAVMAVGVVIGAATQVGNALNLLPGMAVLGLYGMALAGIGLAVGGLIRPSLAAPVTIILGLAFYLIDLIGSILDLPDFIVDLALNRHLGRPILGSYDDVGIVVSVALAVGGVILCAVGVRRRDIGR
ncbi:MAG: ABC transporter permease subunit [Chloroflexi bacterium]|nr:ABC transporter permease subunit [Chloroflexota bacterium]